MQTPLAIADAAPDAAKAEVCYVKRIPGNEGIFPVDFSCGDGFRLKDGASGILASAERFAARRTQCCDPDPFVYVPGPGAAAASASTCSPGHSSMERAAAACSADGGCALVQRGDCHEYCHDCHWVYRGNGADGIGAACVTIDSIRPVRCCSDTAIDNYSERDCNGL